jgi:hypothetical protein
MEESQQGSIMILCDNKSMISMMKILYFIAGISTYQSNITFYK